jgi:hypothetical protein
MIANSMIFNEMYGNNYNKYLSVQGCSEYPAHDHHYICYKSLGLPLFSSYIKNNPIDNNLIELFGKEYSKKDHLQNYIKLILEILEPLNVYSKDKKNGMLFEPYVLSDFLEDIEKNNKRGNILTKTFSADNKLLTLKEGYMGDMTIDNDPNFLIGIKTNAEEIRKISKTLSRSAASYPERCRKVQIAHTALRLVYSQGYIIPLLAVKLWKDYKLSAWDSMWLAYKIKYGIYTGSSDYGDWYTINEGYCTHETFIKRFFTPTLNDSVMSHFTPEKNDLETFYNISPLNNNILTSSNILKKIDKNYYGSNSGGNLIPKSFIKFFQNPESQNIITEIVENAHDSISVDSVKIFFKFVNKLFHSTVVKVKYEGVIYPKSRLQRIIFKDENEVVLSVLKTSKFIDIC